MSDYPLNTNDRPVVISRDQACQHGLEIATLISVLKEFSFYQDARVRNGFRWYRLQKHHAQALLPFWNDADIERISQQMRNQGLLLLASAPFTTCGELKFAFNEREQQQESQSREATAPQPEFTGGQKLPITPNWQPNPETLTRIGEHAIPESFTRAQVPEFVSYWRERGDGQRAWGAKFQTHVLRRWRQHQTDQARLQKNQSQQTTLPPNWQPDNQVVAQLRNEDIPLAHVEDCANRFRLYYHETGTTTASWSMTFYSWVKKDWQEKETPFLPNRKPVSMTSQWRPAEHTITYLAQLDIDRQFISECIPEFVHKWIENGGFRSNWGDLFSQHVSKQWAYFREGVEINPTATLINQQWQPSIECRELLQRQCEMSETFINAQIPEFVLYWRNRGEPKHSWDSIFIRHSKYIWAKQHQLSTNQQTHGNEKQQSGDPKRSTRDVSLEENLSDRSWAY